MHGLHAIDAHRKKKEDEKKRKKEDKPVETSLKNTTCAHVHIN